MYLYIDKYTPNDTRTHDSSSWYVYGTEDVSGVTAPLYSIIDSVESKESFKLPISLTAHKLWVKVERNMSDGSMLEPPVFIVDGSPASITPTMEAPVETPSITILSNNLGTGGSLSLVGTHIEPIHNVLEEAFWCVLVDGKTTIAKKVVGSTTVTFTSDEVALGSSTDLVVTVVYRSLEGVSSHAGELIVISNQDTTTRIYGINSIDPIDTFTIRLNTGAEVLSYILSDNTGKILLHSMGADIPSAILSYATYYRLVVNVDYGNGEFKMIDATIKTISAENPYEIDMGYEYTATKPWKAFPILGEFVIDEALRGYMLKPAETSCMIIDTNKGNEPVGQLPHYRVNELNYEKQYHIRNMTNHLFSIYNGDSISVYDIVQDVRSFIIKNEITVRSISNVTYYDGNFYYVNNNLDIIQVGYNSNDGVVFTTLPTFLNPDANGKFAIEAVNGYLYISGALDALLRVKIGDKDNDYLQALPNQLLTTMIVMKNHDLLLITEDKLNAFKYNFKDDNFTAFPLSSAVKGVIRNQDGSIVIVEDNTTGVIHY